MARNPVRVEMPGSWKLVPKNPRITDAGSRVADTTVKTVTMLFVWWATRET